MIGLIAGLFVWQNKKDQQRTDRLAELAQELGCGAVQTFDFEGTGEGGSAVHIDQGEITYPRMPPEAGNHRSKWPPTGVYTEPLETEFSTHNLEHGNVLIQYKETVPEEVQTELNDVAIKEPFWVITAPYAEFDQNQVLSMTAWEVRLDCPKTTAAQAEQFGELAQAFVDAHKDQGPESVPGTPGGAMTNGTPPGSSPSQSGTEPAAPAPTQTQT